QSRGSHDSAARVSCRATHVEAADGSSILRPSRSGSKEKELLERQFTLKDVSLAQTEHGFDIQRRQYLAVENQASQVGRVFGDRVHHRIAELFALLIPGAFLEVVGRILNEARQDV